MEQQKVSDLKKTLAKWLTRPMRYYLDTCTRCGLCYNSCHVFQGISKKEYTPVGRAEVVRKLYKKYYTLAGYISKYLGDSVKFNDAVMNDLYDAAWSCTGCRRCVVNCPFGIDTGLIMQAAKNLLIENGNAPEDIIMLADAAVEKGKSIDLFKDGYKQVIHDLEKQVQSRLNLSSPDNLIPMEKQNANVLYAGLAGAHTIVNPAIIFNAAKEDWALSLFEAVNFGFFAGDPEKTNIIARRIIDEAIALNVKELVIVECGTAFKIMRYLMGELPFKVLSIVEKIHQYMSEGRIILKDGAITKPVTYHDPCQLGRNAGIYDEPREVICKIAKNFNEMTPEREDNWCCGGGGGLSALENDDFKIKSGKAKKDQIVNTKAEIVVSACENCVTQLKMIKSGYNLDIEVKYFTELVCENLVI
jgi:Fe-S oxidoreductase